MRLSVLGLAALLAAEIGCARTSDRLSEEARFFLDRCNATDVDSLPNCTSALEKADELQVDDPTSLDAALIESSARSGLGRFDFLTFVANLADLQESGGDDYARFRRFVTDYEADELEAGAQIDLDQLAGSITVFDGLLDDAEVDEDGVATDSLVRRAAFQVGLLKALDAFIRPVKVAGGGIENVANIIDTVTALIRTDFLEGDDNLDLGGADPDEFSDILVPIRENYCRCALQTPGLGAKPGFTITCLRDLMRCELYNGNGIEQDYSGNGDVTLADCDTLLDPAGLAACGVADTGTVGDSGE